MKINANNLQISLGYISKYTGIKKPELYDNIVNGKNILKKDLDKIWECLEGQRRVIVRIQEQIDPDRYV